MADTGKTLYKPVDWADLPNNVRQYDDLSPEEKALWDKLHAEKMKKFDEYQKNSGLTK